MGNYIRPTTLCRRSTVDGDVEQVEDDTPPTSPAVTLLAGAVSVYSANEAFFVFIFEWLLSGCLVVCKRDTSHKQRANGGVITCDIKLALLDWDY